jgi:hypothetical protein
MQTVKTPMAFRDDEELFTRLAERFGEDGWIVIPNTLHLETLYASPDLREALEANPICSIERDPIEVSFRDGRHQLAFD